MTQTLLTVEACESLRRRIKDVAEACHPLRGPYPPGNAPGGEAIANVTLAYRHLEDAAMRLGKAIQVLDGGVSVYDKTQVPAT